jgi:ATP-dependent helicase/DNAse subunit B
LLDDITLPPAGNFGEYHTKLNEILERYFTDGSEAAAQQTEKIRAILQRLERIITFQENIGLNDLAGILSRFFESVKIPPETVQPGIYCNDLMDMRGLNFDGLILLGLVDGEFPANRAENALFRNDQRRAFNQRANAPIFTESGADLAEEKFLLYLLTSRVTQRLLVTYPEADNRGRVLPVSPFVNELLSCQSADKDTEAIKWEAIPAGQVLPETGAIASQNDLLQVILTGTDEMVNLISLVDQNYLTKIRVQQNNERQRLSGDGLRNGVLSNAKIFPEFFAAPLSVTKLQNYSDCRLPICAITSGKSTFGRPADRARSAGGRPLIHKTLELL